MHVAIIPDGNRRWAKEQGLQATQGYREVAKKGLKEQSQLSQLIQKARKLDIKTLSLWVFSTENWSRPQEEQETLFSLLEENISTLKESLLKAQTKFVWLGRRDRVKKSIREKLTELEKQHNKGEFIFQLCFDYGGRDEILRAVNKAVQSQEKQTIETFSELLDSKDEPDIIIRTSGEMRLSGFMPWQSVYAELFFLEKHFPDFMPEDLEAVIKEFSLRSRRFGGS